jgi:hypothetical protein
MKHKFLQSIKWIGKKTFKMLILLGLAMLLIFLTYKYLTRNEIFIEFSENNIRVKILIPKKIVKDKDCQKFLEWQKSYLPEKIHQKCPWANI